MKAIARKVWNEQSAALGVIGSAALLILALVNGEALDAERLATIAVPAMVGLGARRRP